MSKYSQTILVELLSQFKYRNIALLLVFCFQSKCLVSSYPLCKILPPIAVQKSLSTRKRLLLYVQIFPNYSRQIPLKPV